MQKLEVRQGSSVDHKEVKYVGRGYLSSNGELADQSEVPKLQTLEEPYMDYDVEPGADCEDR
jgi:hypothetical protein